MMDGSVPSWLFVSVGKFLRVPSRMNSERRAETHPRRIRLKILSILFLEAGEPMARAGFELVLSDL